LRTAVTGIPNPNAAQQNERADGGTGLYYYRARYYDPVRSRFVQKDPLGLAGGIDFYAYTLNNPVSEADPLGLEVQVCVRPLSGPKPLSNYDHTFLYSTNTQTGYGLGPKPGWDVLTPWTKVPGEIEKDYPYDSSGRIEPHNQCNTE
jgi:RHS repeat-associated protein